MTAAQLRGVTIYAPAPATVTFLVDGREVEYEGYGVDSPSLPKSRLIIYLKEVPCKPQDQSASSTSTGSSPTSGEVPAQSTDATTTR